MSRHHQANTYSDTMISIWGVCVVCADASMARVDMDNKVGRVVAIHAEDTPALWTGRN